MLIECNYFVSKENSKCVLQCLVFIGTISQRSTLSICTTVPIVS